MYCSNTWFAKFNFGGGTHNFGWSGEIVFCCWECYKTSFSSLPSPSRIIECREINMVFFVISFQYAHNVVFFAQ